MSPKTSYTHLNIQATPANMADNDDQSQEELNCTRAITGGNNATYQAIYICETCQLLPPQSNDGKDSNDMEPLPSCICQSCAEVCHADHEVYFVGMGLCICDCPNMVMIDEQDGQIRGCCVLEEQSIAEAKKLGFDCTNNDDEMKHLNRPLPVIAIPPEDVQDGKSEGNNDNNAQCNEVNTSLGGYSFGAYTLPNMSQDMKMCEDLIRQAEVLVGESKETFWVPASDDKNCSEDEKEEDWCDLEILAREIYQQHVRAYCHENGVVLDTSTGGAEWWVQYKPVGSEKAPVDLHYDKDEILAEKFGVGSFPTLSTVTYLTGRNNDDSNDNKNMTDNEPTVIFSHTYSDDEDKPIDTMLLSHAVRGKHVVFDGRLLHGAPSNAVWQTTSKQSSTTTSSLRVTFLVNVWLTGKPAGIDILSEDIRSKVVKANSFVSKRGNEMLPDFSEREVSRFHVHDSGEGTVILPFVSVGATWIDDDAQQDSTDGVIDEAEAIGKEEDDEEKEEDEDDDNEEEEEELVLALPRFEYTTNDHSDTVLFTFDDGSARLVRGDGEEDSTEG